MKKWLEIKPGVKDIFLELDNNTDSKTLPTV